ncbi:hypothetical protein OG426_54740 (plasmid) [Streptomyces canus]|uniref:hypothetical protein n=1 Tax=Streptomyces canus TaxID=58343 RepID=UPI002F90B6B4|nr:hypothetical protein OG426_54740 [Streptomyces canus]
MMSKQHPAEKPAPFLELRIGGVYLIIQRVPYSVLAVVTGLATSMGGAIWLGR